MSMMEEIGPRLPGRMAVYLQARELLSLARRATEATAYGRNADLQLALSCLDRMRALLGEQQ